DHHARDAEEDEQEEGPVARRGLKNLFHRLPEPPSHVPHEVVRVLHEHGQDPGEHDEDHRRHCEHLGHLVERLILELRRRLEHADERADHERREQDGERELDRDPEGFAPQVDRQAEIAAVHQKKLCTREPITRCHPSTRTKSRILKGSEMRKGGSTIMPIEISEAETTRSMTRKGRKRAKPMMNARLSSLIMNEGIRTVVGTSSVIQGLPSPGRGCLVMSMKSRTSWTRACLNMKSRRCVSARWKAIDWEICCEGFVLV